MLIDEISFLILFYLKLQNFMIKIPPEELVRYFYNETSEQETAAIKAALPNDINLRKSFEELLSAQQSLNKINLSPGQQAINKILKYASKK
jgi:hypothetical protein